MVSIGTCNLHVVHNAFGQALTVYGHDAEDLALSLFYWFRLSSCRREDLASVLNALGVEKHHFLRHVSSRWLYLEPAIQRIIEQWEALASCIMKLPQLHFLNVSRLSSPSFAPCFKQKGP